MIIILVGASGTGKDTLINMIKEKYGDIPKAISWTTRKPRSNNSVLEVEGEDYYFVDPVEEDINSLKKLIDSSAAFDYHRGEFYGTRTVEFEKCSIVWCAMSKKGAIELVEKFGRSQCMLIFMTCIREVLIERMVKRGESLETLTRKLNTVDEELSLQGLSDVDYYISNNYDKQFLEAYVDDIVEDLNKTK